MRGLNPYICLAGIPLGVERVEFQLQAVLGGFAGVDIAAAERNLERAIIRLSSNSSRVVWKRVGMRFVCSRCICSSATWKRSGLCFLKVACLVQNTRAFRFIFRAVRVTAPPWLSSGKPMRPRRLARALADLVPQTANWSAAFGFFNMPQSWN